MTVNPELGLEIDGQRFIVKLYFKKEKLRPNGLSVIGHLMYEALQCDPDVMVAVLDTRRGRLLVPTPVEDVNVQLEGEAAYWVSVASSLESASEGGVGGVV